MTNGVSKLCSSLIKGDHRALSKAITLLENKTDAGVKAAGELLDLVMPHTGKSFHIGISGTPGVGKSTLIEILGLNLISQGKKVAVLAIDPTSPLTGGSLLGDKTRMSKLGASDKAYVRPSPSGGLLGGVAAGTYDAILVLEAAGFDVIFIETVGVGQSEAGVYNLCDSFLLLLQPGSGDDLQVIKCGVLELADVVAINKYDSQLKNAAAAAKNLYESVLNMSSTKNNVPVLLVSALENKGIDELWQVLADKIAQNKQTGLLDQRRKQQLKVLFHAQLESELLRSYFANLSNQKTADLALQQVLNGKSSIKAQAVEIVGKFLLMSFRL